MKNLFFLLVRGGVALCIALLGASCAATSATSHAGNTRTLPVSAAGNIDSARAFESNGSVYVPGTIRKPYGHHLPHSAHVDVELLDASGRVIATRQDAIDAAHPRIEQRRGGNYPFALGFADDVAGRVRSIRVVYHAHAHS